MRKLSFHKLIIIILLALSLIFFTLQQVFFHNLHESGFLLFQDLYFVPIEILLVTFLLEKVISDREKKARLEHQNIVISAFFSEVGNNAIRRLNCFIDNIDEISSHLNMNQKWESSDFSAAEKALKHIDYEIKTSKDLLITLKEILPRKKEYILSLFSNPNLLEIDEFTDMLWALYHLIDEIEHRDDIAALPASDIEHLSGDIARIYKMLVLSWIVYMKHLKEKYPYLFSIAVRKNPFADNCIIVQ